MRPVLAICRHAVSDDQTAVSLACEAEGPVGVEISARPLELEAAIASGSAIRTLSSGEVAVRYHFPLGSHELSDADSSRADEAVRVMSRLVDLIARSDGGSLTVHAPLPSDSRGTKRLAETRARLREITAYGADAGVVVCLENLRWGLTSEPDAFIDLAEHAGSRVTFDVGHGISSTAGENGSPAPSFVHALDGLIATAHVYGRETDRHHPPTSPDEIAPVLQALCDVGCAWWTIELLDLEEIRTTREMVSQSRC